MLHCYISVTNERMKKLMKIFVYDRVQKQSEIDKNHDRAICTFHRKLLSTAFIDIPVGHVQQ